MINSTFLLDMADFIGIVSFALGGGVIRDIVAGKMPFAFINYYPVVIVVAVLFFSIVFKLHKKSKIEKSKYLVLSDSIGLISFSISGALVGLYAGFNFFGVSFLAVITATGGGVMRDMLLNKIPFLLTSELYGTISLLIGLLIYILNIYNSINIFSLSFVFIIGLIFRLLAYNKKWHLPQLE